MPRGGARHPGGAGPAAAHVDHDQHQHEPLEHADFDIERDKDLDDQHELLHQQHAEHGAAAGARTCAGASDCVGTHAFASLLYLFDGASHDPGCTRCRILAEPRPLLDRLLASQAEPKASL